MKKSSVFNNLVGINLFFFECFCFIKEFVGDPARNVKVLGNHLVKARQKTKPKYAARHLVRVLFPKKTLLCSVMGASARGRRTLDPNKIAAIRGMLPFKMHRFASFILNEVLKLGVLFCMFLANHYLATGEQINGIVDVFISLQFV